MKIKATAFEGLKIIQPRRFEDERGYFFEGFHSEKFKGLVQSSFIQDNISRSKRGVLRGLHLQLSPHGQSKLVSVLQGEVLDVVLDLRPNSKTFAQHFKQVLSEENGTQLLIPAGFAHGFVVRSESALFHYKCDNHYHQESESGVLYNDPELGLDWEYPMDKVLVSEKDSALPSLSEFVELLKKRL